MDKSKVKPSNFSGKKVLKAVAAVAKSALPAGQLVQTVKAFDRKNNGKGSDYKPGTKIPRRVPAVEESLMKDDNLG